VGPLPTKSSGRSASVAHGADRGHTGLTRQARLGRIGCPKCVG
jgi:hypothetical protein